MGTEGPKAEKSAVVAAVAVIDMLVYQLMIKINEYYIEIFFQFFNIDHIKKYDRH